MRQSYKSFMSFHGTCIPLQTGCLPLVPSLHHSGDFFVTAREMGQAFSLSNKNEQNFQHTSTFICFFSKTNRILFIIIKYPPSLILCPHAEARVPEKHDFIKFILLSWCCYWVSLAAMQTEGRSAKALAGWFSQLSLQHWKITASSFHRLGIFHMGILKVLFSSTTVGTRDQHRQSVRGCVSKVL